MQAANPRQADTAATQRMLRLLWPLLLLALFDTQPLFALDTAGGAPAYTPTPAVAYPGHVSSLRDITYAELPGFRPLTLDLYLPTTGTARRPVVVYVHGGAWRRRSARDGGTFGDFPGVLAAIAARGYVVASVNYRFSGESGFPAAVQDVMAAIRWLRQRAADYDADPDRFVVWGSSAGAHTAALIGTACDAAELQMPLPEHSAAPLPSACVQGVIDWYGLVDPANHAADLAGTDPARANRYLNAYLGCEIPLCPAERMRLASPGEWIDAGDPPFLIQHGTADVTVSPRQSERLYATLRAAGVSAELVLYPDVAHGFARVPEGGPDDTVNERAVAEVVRFLGRYFPVH